MKPSPHQLIRRISRYFYCLMCVAAFFILTLSSFAKEAPLTAIVLFDSPHGPSYVQVSGVTLNGKTELRTCEGVLKFDKRTYDVMPRIQLKPGSVLERTADGVLMLSMDGGTPFCVVQNGLKFDKAPELTPAQAADQALLFLPVITPGQSIELPPVKPGVQITFVSAADTELAEYLRAQHAQAIDLWQDYLKRYPSGAHTVQAKQAVAAMLLQNAESTLAEYSRTANSGHPQLPLLKKAANYAKQAQTFSGATAGPQKLIPAIHSQLNTILEQSRRELQQYQKAETDRAPGYIHLGAAKRGVEEVLEVEPEYAPAVTLNNEVGSEETKLDSTLHNAEGMLLGKRYDEALNAIDAYRGMATELPRVATIADAAYKFHFAHGQLLGAQGTWDQAAGEFRAALKVRPESQEAGAMLKNAESQAAANFNQHLVEQALADSRNYVQKNDVISAYEVLAKLPPQQRAQVTDQLEVLKKDYVPAATRRAQKLQEIHLPMRGRADEEGVRQAYELLQRAGVLSGDPAVKLRLDLLSDKLAAYYLDQAHRYLQKPMSSGVGLGWLYLREAQRYQPNLDAVKDDMARYQAAYQLRGRLSIGVVVRDQSSRRDSPGFADQLGDAIANALESSSQPVKVVRRYSEDPSQVQPDFVVVAEVLQHRMVKNSSLETLPSKYRAGTREVKNEAWLNTNQEYTQAQQDLAQAQHALNDAQQRHSKKDIATATDNLADAQKKLDDLRKNLDTLNPTRPEAVVEPYNYTKKTIDLTAVVELAFRLTDQSGNLVDSMPSVRREDHKKAEVLENVKPEDTEGVQALNIPPDEAQFVTDLELQARDALVKSITEKALLLPEKILQQARQRSQQQDSDGAAAQYIIYLNSTPETGSPDRAEAMQYLREHFNLAVPEAPASRQAQAR